MELAEFWTICSTNGVVLELEQLNTLTRFHDELVYWNERVNLISRKEESKIFENHIMHSLTILKYLDIPQRATCLDIGTGGGFPGIPLKIARQDLHFTLIDSIAKKVKITEMMAKHTGYKNIEVLCGRAEDMYEKKKYIKYFDFVFSRAVSKLENILAWSIQVIKPKSKIILLKGGDLKEEIAEAKETFRALHVEEISIKFRGADWFETDNKKLLICSFK